MIFYGHTKTLWACKDTSSLFVWLWLVVNDRKFSAGIVFFSHTNQPAVLLHETAIKRTNQPNRLYITISTLLIGTPVLLHTSCREPNRGKSSASTIGHAHYIYIIISFRVLLAHNLYNIGLVQLSNFGCANLEKCTVAFRLYLVIIVQPLTNQAQNVHLAKYNQTV